MHKRIFLFLILILSISPVFAESMIHHNISVTVDPYKYYLEATDEITIPADQIKPVMYFLLNNNLTVNSESPDVILKLDKSGIKAEDFGMDREDFDASSDKSENKYSLTFKGQPKEDVTFILKYRGVIHYPIEQLGEEYARGFSQTPGIIDSQGVYLGGSTYWVPWFNNNWINFGSEQSVLSFQ